MKTLTTFILFASLPFAMLGQSNPKGTKQLIDSVNSAWPTILSLSQNATNKVTILPAIAPDAKKAISELQQSTRLPLGAVVYHTGGIIIDDGWIRVLGSGHPLLKRSLPQWNKNKSIGKKFTLIADDVIGGYYMLNNGELGTDTGKVYYLSPKSLSRQPLSMDYSQFLQFCFSGDLNKFYTGLRWKTWREDVKAVDMGTVYIFLPFLWANNSQNIDKAIRRTISVEEKYFLLEQEMQNKKPK